MCVIERRLYTYTDGPSRTVESTKYCHRAVGRRLCNRVDRRETQQALIVERRPSTAGGPSDNYILTEGSHGRTRIYRDLSNRSSHSSSVRRSTTSERSRESIPSSASSAPDAGLSATSAPSMYPERTRAPYPPVLPVRTVEEDGTAIYDRPPSLDMPRASENERSRPQRTSGSSMRAEVNDLGRSPPRPVSPPRRRPPPTVRTDTDSRPSNLSEAQGSSRAHPRRRDSHRSSRQAADIDRERDQERERQRERERDRRRQEEDDRQAQLERDRIAASDRRQSAREDQYREDQRRRDASIERHRRAAAEALEGEQPPPPITPFQIRADAERAQMARERAATAARRRESRDSADAAAFRYAQEQMRADDAARARFYSTMRQDPGRSRPPSSRRMTGDSFGPSSPTSARSSTYNRPPVVHQGPGYGPSRPRNSFSARGDDVIAREQARAAAEEQLNAGMGGMRIDDAEGDYAYDEYTDRYVPVEEYEYIYGDGRTRRRHL